ncbi:NADH:flavin oxidoreductase [Paenibacillus abyssi]|uniref:NADH:flavin oxidoreductase n=1 Tax=Paenibacillus abyssi TaxID=1340531 RepID=A0A917CNP6_9BACL|nr:NADH:flavin oxidoreductase [Paenibacillus abyssi]GGF93372.1 NADH:flavin oxidoreductase [Paenibacillus abyssi]
MTETTTFPTLLSDIQIGNMKLKNRIGLAPMTRISATEDGQATEIMQKYYESFARGGYGLLITEGAYPDEAYSQGYFNQSGIANDKHVAAWKKVTEAVHQAGSKIIVQLMHAGAQGQGNTYKEKFIAPSTTPAKGEQLPFYVGEGPYYAPKPMTKEDIQDVIQGFVEAAKHAKAAGFDGVEIHGANGYLLDEFLTDYMNQRTDEYGGSTENRVRLLVEVSKAVRAAVGSDFVVGIRISQGKVSDYNHKWANGEKDAEIIFSSLSEAGLDYIHVTEYDAARPAFEGTEHSLAALAKKHGSVPVIANGNLEDPDKAEQFLAQGEADLITLGKGALANHDWPQRIVNGQPLQPFNPEILGPKANIKEQEI